jgi:hypothetical protein
MGVGVSVIATKPIECGKKLTQGNYLFVDEQVRLLFHCKYFKYLIWNQNFSLYIYLGIFENFLSVKKMPYSRI